MYYQNSVSVLLLLLFVVSSSLSLHTISRKTIETQDSNATDVKNITSDDSTLNTSAFDTSAFDTSAFNASGIGIDFADNTSETSVVTQNNTELEVKSINTTKLTQNSDDPLSETTILGQTSAVMTSDPTLNSTPTLTEDSTDKEVIDFSNDLNSAKSNLFYDTIRYESLKLKFIEFEDKMKELMNRNLFYSIAIPAAVGIAVAVALVLLVCCCRSCGKCSARCCYRLFCCCCQSKSRRNNRLKYVKSKHLFGDEKNYLLVSNNESDAELET